MFIIIIARWGNQLAANTLGECQTDSTELWPPWADLDERSLLMGVCRTPHTSLTFSEWRNITPLELCWNICTFFAAAEDENIWDFWKGALALATLATQPLAPAFGPRIFDQYGHGRGVGFVRVVHSAKKPAVNGTANLWLEMFANRNRVAK